MNKLVTLLVTSEIVKIVKELTPVKSHALNNPNAELRPLVRSTVLVPASVCTCCASIWHDPIRSGRPWSDDEIKGESNMGAQALLPVEYLT